MLEMPSAMYLGEPIRKEMKIFEKYLSSLEGFIAKAPSFYGFLKRSKVGYQRLKYRLLRKRSDRTDVIFDRSFFDKNLEWNMPIAGKLVDVLMRYFHPRSVVDVGCGNAEFLSVFQKRDVLIKGYEGSHHAIDSSLIGKEFIEQFDLKNTIQDSRKYDLVLCLEVAEHIEKDYSQKLVENVTKLGDVILFSAAPPGQGGHFHMNEQPREFWINFFAIRNFSIDEHLTEALKNEMIKKGILSWYCDNLMVFKRS